MITFKLPNKVLFRGKKEGAFNPLLLGSLDWTVTYNNTDKIAFVVFKGINRKLVLWEGNDYDDAGQFTDADVEAQVIKLMGISKSSIAE